MARFVDERAIVIGKLVNWYRYRRALRTVERRQWMWPTEDVCDTVDVFARKVYSYYHIDRSEES